MMVGNLRNPQHYLKFAIILLSPCLVREMRWGGSNQRCVHVNKTWSPGPVSSWRGECNNNNNNNNSSSSSSNVNSWFRQVRMLRERERKVSCSADPSVRCALIQLHWLFTPACTHLSPGWLTRPARLAVITPVLRRRLEPALFHSCQLGVGGMTQNSYHGINWILHGNGIYRGINVVM